MSLEPGFGRLHIILLFAEEEALHHSSDGALAVFVFSSGAADYSLDSLSNVDCSKGGFVEVVRVSVAASDELVALFPRIAGYES